MAPIGIPRSIAQKEGSWSKVKTQKPRIAPNHAALSAAQPKRSGGSFLSGCVGGLLEFSRCIRDRVTQELKIKRHEKRV
jgi:hypothetical protein